MKSPGEEISGSVFSPLRPRLAQARVHNKQIFIKACCRALVGNHRQTLLRGLARTPAAPSEGRDPRLGVLEEEGRPVDSRSCHSCSPWGESECLWTVHGLARPCPAGMVAGHAFLDPCGVTSSCERSGRTLGALPEPSSLLKLRGSQQGSQGGARAGQAVLFQDCFQGPSPSEPGFPTNACSPSISHWLWEESWCVCACRCLRVHAHACCTLPRKPQSTSKGFPLPGALCLVLADGPYTCPGHTASSLSAHRACPLPTPARGVHLPGSTSPLYP